MRRIIFYITFGAVDISKPERAKGGGDGCGIYFNVSLCWPWKKS